MSVSDRPSCVSRGITLVISPLLSLIHDQVLQLNAIGINAVYFSSNNNNNNNNNDNDYGNNMLYDQVIYFIIIIIIYIIIICLLLFSFVNLNVQ